MGDRKNNLWRGVLFLFLAVLLTQCKAIGQDKGEQEGAIANCFTQLYPGKVVQNRLTQIIFQNGACFGEYKALNKISYHNKVMVSGDGLALGNAAESVLSIGDDYSVSVQTATGPKRIGAIDRKTYAIKTEPGVEFSLMVPDAAGEMSHWSLENNQGDTGAALEGAQNERIIINVPY